MTRIGISRFETSQLKVNRLQILLGGIILSPLQRVDGGAVLRAQVPEVRVILPVQHRVAHRRPRVPHKVLDDRRRRRHLGVPELPSPLEPEPWLLAAPSPEQHEEKQQREHRPLQHPRHRAPLLSLLLLLLLVVGMALWRPAKVRRRASEKRRAARAAEEEGEELLLWRHGPACAPVGAAVAVLRGAAGGGLHGLLGAAVGVVDLALLGVGDDGVGLLHGLEGGLCAAGGVAVGVDAHGELAVGGLDLVAGGGLGDAEARVVALFLGDAGDQLALLGGGEVVSLGRGALARIRIRRSGSRRRRL